MIMPALTQRALKKCLLISQTRMTTAIVVMACLASFYSSMANAEEPLLEETQEPVIVENVMEKIMIPIGQQGSDESKKPTQGMSKDSVLQTYGEPERKRPAVGDPPISSWLYKNFVVYFESDFVIHSVFKHKTPEQQTDDTTDTTSPTQAAP